IVKDRLYNPDKYELGKEPAQYVLYQTVLNSLKLMAPVMPYITEEIYHLYFNELEGKRSIHISDWPEPRKNWIDNEAEKAGDMLIKLLASIRQYKQEKGVSLGAELKAIYIEPKEKKDKKLLEKIILDLKGASRAEKIKVGKGKGTEIETEAPVKLSIKE
ncbi:MAG: class I tRNA ligase family protein, partial [Candidatus Undinarchaeales archaeon]